MNEQIKRAKQLQELLIDNFLVARHCRKSTEIISEVSLSYYFQKLASKRSQFAVELGQQTTRLQEVKPAVSPASYENRWSEKAPEDKLKIVRKSIKLYKISLAKYKKALSQINEGGCREILIRHKAHIANTISEMKALKMLLKEKEVRKAGEEPQKIHEIL
ncbi:hypothetical protein [Salinimicrobium flavum]|uniref:DUF2383 domain-containing protein n=1 Tax=Salinimicrobium flavum TaxID=1737065 RepID=A0ABW5IX87_9FLAO